MKRSPINLNEVEGILHYNILKNLSEQVKKYNGCKVIVETGVGKGEGARALLDGNPKAAYYGYDSWDNLDAPNENVSKSNLEKYKSSTLIKSDSMKMSFREFPVADLFVVDGDHTFKGCLNDLNLAEKVISDKGIILVHDMDTKPVVDAVEEWYKNKKDKFNKSLVHHEHGWAIIWRK